MLHLCNRRFSVLVVDRRPAISIQSVKSDVHLASISGGTDILGCFALGNPTLPVRAGHIQCLGLGMDICAYRLGHEASGSSAGGEEDESDKEEGLWRSRKADPGEMGELVCRCDVEQFAMHGNQSYGSRPA